MTSTGRIPKVLVLQDEQDTRSLIRENLTREKMQIYEMTEAEQAFEEIKERVPDLLILNTARPKLSTLELCKWVRSNDRTQHIPILIVSAEAGSADKVLGLEVGADDYLAEPFRPDELTARVKALLRRNQAIGKSRPGLVYQHGHLRIDFATRQVFVGDKERYLPLKQFELLTFFVRNPERVIGREELIREIWGEAVAHRTVNVAVRRLRKKVELNDQKPSLVVTVRHVGYRFNPDG